MKQRCDRIGFARAAIENLVPLVLERGTRQMQPQMPEYIELLMNGLRIIYSPSVKTLPTNVRPRQVLDIWPVPGRKVFCVEWDPMYITAFHAGPWQDQLHAILAQRRLH
jgi:hypothetical protein